MKVMVSAYLDNNIGDDLMIKLLSEYFPRDEFYIYTNKSVIKNTFSNCGNIFIKSENERNKDIDNIDIFLSIGGSIFNDLNSLKGQINRLRKILFIKKLKRKKKLIVTLGCNLGPYRDKVGPFLTKLELKNNDLVTVRDRYSFEMLKSFKSIRNYHLASDIVYNYATNKEDIPKCYGLGISAYRSVKTNDVNYQNYKVLAAIIDKYIDKTEKKVILFAFDSEKENDLSAAHHILNLSKRNDKIEIAAYLGEHENFINKMGECEKFIAIRFHSAVISELLNIPFLPIIYSNKMEALLEDVGFSGEKYYIEDFNTQKVDIDKIVESIIDGKQLCHGNLQKNNFRHFEELSRLMSK